MKKTTLFLVILLLVFNSCTNEETTSNSNKQLLTNKETKFTSNEHFLKEINSYLKAVDRLSSDFFNPEKGYIFIRIKKKGSDTLEVHVSICLSGDEVEFIIEPLDTLISFFEYNNHRFLLMGNSNNNLIDIKPNFDMQARKEIIKKYYKEEFFKFLKDHCEKPKFEIIDHRIFMILIFDKNGRIIRSDKPYFQFRLQDMIYYRHKM